MTKQKLNIAMIGSGFIGKVYSNAFRQVSHFFDTPYELHLISAIFPLMAVSSGAYPFVFFSIMMVVQFFVVLFVYPETKGFTLEEMQKELKIA